MDIFSDIEARIALALRTLIADGGLPADLMIDGIAAETPRDPTHGDFATNAALVLAKAAKAKPRDIAEKLAKVLADDPGIAKVDVAGPGFVNITMKTGVWQNVLKAVLASGADFGKGEPRPGKTNVEYVSANPTGPMHVGHCRGAVFGDALANLLAFAGYDVSREYYINDAGGQVDVLARSAFLRYREALGETIGDIPQGLYPGDYLKPVGQALAQEFGPDLLTTGEDDWLPRVRQIAIDAMLAMIRDDLAALNIHHNVFFSEASLSRGAVNQIAAAIGALRAKGLIYEGRLEKPKGHDDEEWEDREQTLFRSTAFGDDVDRALMKSDGTYTYFAGDIAYHYDKLQRGYDSLINVFGADHSGYISRMKAAVAALSDNKAAFDIKVVQLVKLFRNGEPFKMSKRAGTFVTLRDVVDEVGRDPVRFMMLYRKNDAPLDFDFQKVTEQSKDNPVFYVQYAHARAESVFRNAVEAIPGLDVGPDGLASARLDLLSVPAELDLIRRLASYPRLIHAAGLAHEPHRLAFWLYETASAFHGLWSKGNDSPHLRFIQANDGVVTTARLALVRATQQVISSGLGILGVDAPLAMR